VHIAFITDTWVPQINGVVIALQALVDSAEANGCTISVISYQDFPSFPVPTYPELRFALALPGQIGRRIRDCGADHVHIATEGSLGLAARLWCKANNHPFTTSFHTRFPEYIAARFPVPLSWSYRVLRWFHNAGAGVIVTTTTLQTELQAQGFDHVAVAPLGVDLSRFRPGDKAYIDLPRPVFLYVGRVAVEKNLAAFLSLNLPGSKVVVGDGPARVQLQARFPDAHFLGMKPHEQTPLYYAAADVFVFPSLTDTFGTVLLEAMACGVPVAAFPVPGPNDVVGGGGILNHDLGKACLEALSVSPEQAMAQAHSFRQSESSARFFQMVRHLAARAKD